MGETRMRQLMAHGVDVAVNVLNSLHNIQKCQMSVSLNYCKMQFKSLDSYFQDQLVQHARQSHAYSTLQNQQSLKSHMTYDSI